MRPYNEFRTTSDRSAFAGALIGAVVAALVTYDVIQRLAEWMR